MTIHDWLCDAVPSRGDDGNGSKSDWLVVKSVVLTVQFLAAFADRFGKEDIRPLGVLIIDVHAVPNFKKSIFDISMYDFDSIFYIWDMQDINNNTNLLTPFFGSSFQSILNTHLTHDLGYT